MAGAFTYIDTHCHLTDARFEADMPEVISRANAAGVAMLTVGTDRTTSARCVEIARAHPGLVRAAVGVHPTEVGGATEADWAEICRLAARPEVAAIGETGLDYHWRDVPADEQKTWFRRHIELALEVDKPLTVHARKSAADVRSELAPWLARGLRAAWHCFAPGKGEVEQALAWAAERGVYLGLGGVVTYPDGKTLRRAATEAPGELLLLETDAPYLLPRPKTRDRNEPDGVIRVAEELAQLRGTAAEAVARETTLNATRLFGFQSEMQNVALGSVVTSALG